MPSSLYGIDPEPLASLNGRAHPGGGTATIEVPSGEGLVEDQFEAQLRGMEIAYREPVARVLANLAGKLEDGGFDKIAVAVDKILEKWAVGPPQPASAPAPAQPATNGTALAELQAQLQIMSGLIDRNFTDWHDVGDATHFRGFGIKSDRNNIQEAFVGFSRLIEDKNYTKAAVYRQELDSAIADASGSLTHHLSAAFPDAPGDSVAFTSAWDKAKEAFKLLTEATKPVVPQLQRTEPSEPFNMEEQSSYSALMTKYNAAKGMGSKLDKDLASYRLRVRDPQKLAVLNQYIDTVVAAQMPLYNQWDKAEQEMSSLGQTQSADNTQTINLGKYFDDVVNTTNGILAGVERRIETLARSE